MTTITLRIPDSLHNQISELADQEGISVDQFVVLAMTEKASAIATESSLEERAKRGSRDKFMAAMAKVADIEPPDVRDRL